ncbi:unnamed protein product [Amaranthus hypochondriacus]
MAKTHRKISLFSILVFLFVTLCYGDINQDKQECASQLVGLATCLPYVSGQAKAPTQDCCAGFKQVLKESRKCVCILVKDRDDPSLGLKINATLALTLPATCHSPASVNDCPALLHLAPNSPEAKVFTDVAKALAPASSTTATSTDKPSSGGGGGGASAKETAGKNSAPGKRRLIAQMFYGVFLWCFVSHLVF